MHEEILEDSPRKQQKVSEFLTKKRKIPSWEYLNLKTQDRDPDLNILHIKRKCFIFQKTTYTIDEYILKPQIVVLKKHRTKDNLCSSIEHLPHWLGHYIDKIITNDENYSSWGIADHLSEIAK